VARRLPKSRQISSSMQAKPHQGLIRPSLPNRVSRTTWGRNFEEPHGLSLLALRSGMRNGRRRLRAVRPRPLHFLADREANPDSHASPRSMPSRSRTTETPSPSSWPRPPHCGRFGLVRSHVTWCPRVTSRCYRAQEVDCANRGPWTARSHPKAPHGHSPRRPAVTAF